MSDAASAVGFSCAVPGVARGGRRFPHLLWLGGWAAQACACEEQLPLPADELQRG